VPAERAADRLAGELLDAAGGAIDAVIFYGSNLHGAGPGSGSAVDLVVVVSRYDVFYRELHLAGMLHRSPGTFVLLARVLPPNSISVRNRAGDQAKCLVVSRAHLAAALGTRRRDHMLVARLVQQVELIHARDEATRAGIAAEMEGARHDVLRWLAPFLDEVFDAQHAARRMLEVCYSAELRPEAVNRAAVIFERQRSFLCAWMSAVLERGAAAGALTSAGRTGWYRFASRPGRTAALRIRAYLAWSNARVTARWFKHAVTFDGWLDYIAAKVERRTGSPVELSARERRWPAVFLWPRVVRTLVQRPLREGAPAPARCSARQTLAFMRDPPAFTIGAGLELGDFYRVPVPGMRLYVVAEPRLIEEILVAEQHCFEKSRIYWGELRRSFGASMGSLEGDAWVRLHTAQRPYFTPRAVEEYLPLVEDIASRHLERLTGRIRETPEVRIGDVFAELNARLVLHLLFGRAEEPAALELAQRIAAGHALIAWNSRYPWRPVLAHLSGRARAGRAHAAFFRHYADGLADSAATRDPRVLLSALASLARDSVAHGLPPDLLANEVTFHLGASTETQAAAESWALYLLWQHPRVLKAVRSEIRAAADEEPVGARHLPSLPLCRQVLQETLRLYPPVHAILRDCVRPARLSRHDAMPGDTFMISLYALHRNPRLWHDPASFRPERFGGPGPGQGERYHYLPFGAGRHVCIGRHLAMPAAVLVIARFVQLFDWSFTGMASPLAEPSLKPHPSLTARIRPRGFTTSIS
jgi:cytochrome P450